MCLLFTHQQHLLLLGSQQRITTTTAFRIFLLLLFLPLATLCSPLSCPCPSAPCHSLWHNSPNSVLSTKQKHVLYNFLYAWHKSRSIIYLFLSLSLSLSLLLALCGFVLLAHVLYACLILCSFFCHVVLLIITMHFIAAVVVVVIVVLCLLLLFFAYC